MKHFLFLLTLFILWARVGFSQVLGWQSYTSVGEIRDVAIGAGAIWGGSNGGGLLKFDLQSETLTNLTNTDGLSSNEIVALEVDKHGSVWIALFDGRINHYSPDTETFETINVYKEQNQTISDIVAFGDSLYIGLGTGVSLYTIDKREVKETYKNLGFASNGNVQKIAANSITISGSDIWVATDKGIARSSLDSTNLLSPNSWAQYTVAQGLPSNRINKLVVLEAIPYAATTRGVSRLINDQWQSAGLDGENVFSIAVVVANSIFPETSVAAITSKGVFWLKSSDQWQRLGSAFSDVTAFDSGERGNIWIGRKEKGLARYIGNDQWQLFEINGPASNNFSSLALDSKGRLWGASQIAGIHMFDDGIWTNFSRQDGLTNNDQRVVMVDSEDRVWVGSWGGGITIFEETEEGFSLTQIDASDGTLAGVTADPNFVLVTDMAQDEFGNVWIVNHEAVNDRVLPVHTPQGAYQYFLSTFGEIGSSRVRFLEIDRINRIWLATDDLGIKLIDWIGEDNRDQPGLDYEALLFEKTPREFAQGLNVSEDMLLSNKVTAIAEDKDGIMWIGTQEGLNFWQGQVGRQGGLINNVINTIGIDPINNKWIGTPEGISIISDDGRTLTDFTTGNSPLVSNNIQSFAFNDETGEVWVGTTNGLSRLQTPFTAPKENLDQLTGYPNPFILDGFNDEFKIINLAKNTSVNIYSVSGVKVKTFKLSDIPQVTWDGTDDDGNLVPSGIYVFLAFTNNDLAATGKVAVVRR